jgi:hypothetical protein
MKEAAMDEAQHKKGGTITPADIEETLLGGGVPLPQRRSSLVYPQECKLKPGIEAEILDAAPKDGPLTKDDYADILRYNYDASKKLVSVDKLILARFNGLPVREAEQKNLVNPKAGLMLSQLSLEHFKVTPENTLLPQYGAFQIKMGNVKPEHVEGDEKQAYTTLFGPVLAGLPRELKVMGQKEAEPQMHAFWDETFDCTDIKTGTTVKPSEVSFSVKQLREIVPVNAGR